MYRLLIVYRPPTSKKGITFSLFLEEFSTLLESVMMAKGKLIVTGDFNIQMDNAGNANTKKFSVLLDTFGLTQHIQDVTHTSGHIIDLLNTKSHESPIFDVEVTDPLISDHKCISFHLDSTKPQYPQKEITYRKMKDFDLESFQTDLKASLSKFDPSEGSVSEVADRYNTILEATLDKHAPLTTKTVTVRPQPKWNNDAIHEARREK